MSATTAGALKAWIEAGGLGISAYRDRPPEGTAFPYVTIHEDIAQVPDGASTPYDTGVTPGVVETAQVDLWQQWKTPSSNAMAESFSLPGALRKRLNGALLATAPTRVYGVAVTAMQRALDPDNNLVAHHMTVEVTRDL